MFAMALHVGRITGQGLWEENCCEGRQRQEATRRAANVGAAQ